MVVKRGNYAKFGQYTIGIQNIFVGQLSESFEWHNKPWALC